MLLFIINDFNKSEMNMRIPSFKRFRTVPIMRRTNAT